MRTEIDPTLTELSQDLSKDEVCIHYIDSSGERKQVWVGRAFGDGQVTLTLEASVISCGICVEIELGEPDEDGEWHWTTSRIPLGDVYDVQVGCFGDDPGSSEPQPFARWLRSKTGRLVRTNLDL